MIDHDLNIALFEMFDELSNEKLVKEYLILKDELLANQELVSLINKYNEYQEQLVNVSYQSYLDDLNEKCLVITNQLASNEKYQSFLSYELLIEERIVNLSNLVFKDIFEVSNHRGCGSCASK